MRLREVMTSPVATIPAAARAEDAWSRMRERGIHHLVVTAGNAVAGVVSHRDLGGRAGATLRATKTVRDLMTAPAVTAAPDTTVRQAANLMRGRSIGCLVVAAHGGRPAGIVTTADLLDLIGRGVERPVGRVKRWTLTHRVPHKKRTATRPAW